MQHMLQIYMHNICCICATYATSSMLQTTARANDQLPTILQLITAPVAPCRLQPVLIVELMKVEPEQCGDQLAVHDHYDTWRWHGGYALRLSGVRCRTVWRHVRRWLWCACGDERVPGAHGVAGRPCCEWGPA